MTQFYIKTRGHSEPCIFFLDATNPLDIMDYWNLHAIGWRVISIPKQFAQFDKTKQLARDFIEENYVPDHSNPEIYHHTTILKSRSISEDEQRQFSDSLDIACFDETRRNPKISHQIFYPRIWSEWARGPDHVECCDLVTDADEHDISESEETVRFKTLDPEFVSYHYAGLDASRFANEIDIRLYGDKELRAEVIPESEVELARVIDKFSFLDWRISKKGLIYLSRHSENTIDLSLPQAEEVFTRWMKLKGWTVELSSAGRIAKQMILQLGGVEGTWILAQEGIIQLLRKMNSSDEILTELHKEILKLQRLLKQNDLHTAKQEVESFVKNLKKIQLQLGGDGKSLLEEHVRNEIQEITNRLGYEIEDAADRIIQQLLDAKVFNSFQAFHCLKGPRPH